MCCSFARPGVVHCAMILATCLATVTTEDSQESIDHFNWPMSTNHCETSCTNRCKGCYTACGSIWFLKLLFHWPRKTRSDNRKYVCSSRLCYTGQCSKKSYSVAVIIVKNRILSSTFHNCYSNKKMRDMSAAGYVILGNFSCNLCHNKIARRVAQNVA